ncbi:DUF221-domain-containing protein [Ascobolus immersus RN42]|uniref:DUF221-domain-containing protein n=1 Tax=Ascobolus immersus RN42 TaxID=1160509 RepID=A0A3N4IIY3_ASCIM|nr:DUF221-domain-containing protein [Ascobolus immersus RN42]
MADNDVAKQFVELIRNPFNSNFTANALISSLGTSLGMSAAIVLLFCLLRPLNTVVYAPKLRVMDEKHAPPKLSRGLLSWVTPLYTEKEDRLLDMIGMDAIVFLRFLRMCRNMFLFLGIVCSAVIIPVNVLSSKKNYWVGAPTAPLVVMTPVMAWGEGMWAHVVVAYIIDIIVMGFLWWNYRAIARLAQHYFRSDDYQNSQHSRTLMIADIPKKYQKDLGLAEITNHIKPASGDEVFAIGRSVKGLPELIEKHEQIVRELEAVLAKYLRNPNKLPSKRPVCRPHPDDRKNLPSKVDAIEYLNRRMKDLESQIYHARHSIESKKSMPFGFVSYGTIQQAHIAAKASKGKGKSGTFVALAPRPLDILWNNLSQSRAKRRSNAYIGYALFTLLSVIYVVPNALIATFLSDISRIGIFWKGFEGILHRNPKFFAFLQGVASPLVQTIIYLLLPVLMRRLSAWQGDLTKTARERHVTTKLYAFFVFNNLLIFTFFGTIWNFIMVIVEGAQSGKDLRVEIHKFEVRSKITSALSSISSFWIMYLLQRNLGAVLDLAQLISLIWGSFSRKFLSPTPRQIIERSAPPALDYASYYNYFLYYATIALVFATLQPVVLWVAFLYFMVDSWLKKYLLMYIFVTRIESGGQSWRILFNRLLVACILSNCCVGIVVWSQFKWQAAAWLLPLPLILLGFKIYCHKKYDVNVSYFTAGKQEPLAPPRREDSTRAHDRLERRFGHPALNRPLMKPMVHKNAQHCLAGLGLVGEDKDTTRGGDIPLDNMAPGSKGRTAASNMGGFEVVDESQLDYAHWRNRVEFADTHGGYMHGGGYADSDMMTIRSGMMTPPPRFGSPNNSRPSSPAPVNGQRRSMPLSNLVPSNIMQSAMGYAPLSDANSRPHSPYINNKFADSSASFQNVDTLNAANFDAMSQGLMAGASPLPTPQPYQANYAQQHVSQPYQQQSQPGYFPQQGYPQQQQGYPQQGYPQAQQQPQQQQQYPQQQYPSPHSGSGYSSGRQSPGPGRALTPGQPPYQGQGHPGAPGSTSYEDYRKGR